MPPVKAVLAKIVSAMVHASINAITINGTMVSHLVSINPIFCVRRLYIYVDNTRPIGPPKRVSIYIYMARRTENYVDRLLSLSLGEDERPSPKQLC